MLREYLASCGFPCVVLSQEKNELLFKYSDDIILHDIKRRCGIEKKTRIGEGSRTRFEPDETDYACLTLKNYLACAMMELIYVGLTRLNFIWLACFISVPFPFDKNETKNGQ